MRFRSALAAAALCCGLCPVAQAAETTPPLPAIPAPQELVYVPIAPCRAFTLPAGIPANQTRSLQISGAGDFSAQGGPAGGCGVPASARAVAITLHAASSTTGYLTAFADGTPRPATASLNFNANLSDSVGATATLGQNGRLAVYVRKWVAVTGDVTGYYAPQLWALVSASGGVIDSSARVVSSARLQQGRFRVTFDRNVASCGASASSELGAYIVGVSTESNYADVSIYTHTGAFADYWFNLQIMC